MTVLRIHRDDADASLVRTCPECKGRGRVPCPPALATRSGLNGNNLRGAIMVDGTGHPIPCPKCRGSKVVALGGVLGGTQGGTPP